MTIEKSLMHFVFCSAKTWFLLQDYRVNININNAAVKPRLLEGGAITSRLCDLYLFQQVSQLFCSSISGADGLLRSNHCADTSTFSILS